MLPHYLYLCRRHVWFIQAAASNQDLPENGVYNQTLHQTFANLLQPQYTHCEPLRGLNKPHQHPTSTSQKQVASGSVMGQLPSAHIWIWCFNDMHFSAVKYLRSVTQTDSYAKAMCRRQCTDALNQLEKDKTKLESKQFSLQHNSTNFHF